MLFEVITFPVTPRASRIVIVFTALAPVILLNVIGNVSEAATYPVASSKMVGCVIPHVLISAIAAVSVG